MSDLVPVEVTAPGAETGSYLTVVTESLTAIDWPARAVDWESTVPLKEQNLMITVALSETTCKGPSGGMY